jgi:hypothetical protein
MSSLNLFLWRRFITKKCFLFFTLHFHDDQQIFRKATNIKHGLWKEDEGMQCGYIPKSRGNINYCTQEKHAMGHSTSNRILSESTPRTWYTHTHTHTHARRYSKQYTLRFGSIRLWLCETIILCHTHTHVAAGRTASQPTSWELPCNTRNRYHIEPSALRALTHVRIDSGSIRSDNEEQQWRS